MVGYFLSKILPAISALMYDVYLAYIVTNPVRRKSALSKHKKGVADDYGVLSSSPFLQHSV